MEVFSCPGSMRIKDPIPEFFRCPKCGSEVEIWTHENSRKCINCGLVVYREQVPSCIEWCKYGKECVGEEAYNNYMMERKGKDEEEIKEEEKKLLEELMKKCQKRGELNGEKADNQDR